MYKFFNSRAERKHDNVPSLHLFNYTAPLLPSLLPLTPHWSVWHISTGLSNVLSNFSSHHTPILFSLWKILLGPLNIQFSPGSREDCTYWYYVCSKLGLCTLSWPTTSEWKGHVIYIVTSGVKPYLTLQLFLLSPTLAWQGHRKAACVGRYYMKDSCLLTRSTYSGHVVSELSCCHSYVLSHM